MTKKLVHTEAFKKWFKGSKVVDEFGNPKIMYHGSENMDKITVFKSNKGHDYSFFTDDQYEASRYVPAITIKEGGFYIRKTNWAKIKPFYIKALKIFDPQKLSEVEFKKLRGFLRSHEDELIGRLSEFASDEGMSYDEYLAELDYPESASKQEVIEYALTRSTDNWCLLEMDIFQDYIKSNGYDSFISNESGALNIAVYDANNIKLADGSNTTFNPNNPDIRFAKGGKTPKKKVKKKKVYKNKALVKLIDQAKGCIINEDCDGFLIDSIVSEVKNTYIDKRVTDKFRAKTVDKQREQVIKLLEKPDTVIMVAFSGGKDSIAVVFHLLELGIPKERIELHHHDIDGHGEGLFDWACTVDYCKAFAKQFGLRLFFSYREYGIVGGIYRNNEPLKEILYQAIPDGEYIRTYGDKNALNEMLKFPAVSASLDTRWCSGYVKIDVLKRAITSQAILRKANIVVLTGERRAESTARAKYKEIQLHTSSGKGRFVLNWRCVLDYSDEDVWKVMEKYKVQPHPAYELGWSRCSCQTCIFNSPNTWASLNEISPEKVDRIGEIERDIGNTLYHKRDKTVDGVKGKVIRITIHEKVASGVSFLTDQLKVDWKDQAIKKFTKPIVVKKWVLPIGAKSTEVSGAN